MKRRAFLKGGLGAATAPAVSLATALTPTFAVAQPIAQSETLAKLVKAYAGDAKVSEGRVRLKISPIIDNGNAVPVEVEVESPMTATDHVVGIALFNEKNPENDIAQFTLTPMMGRARVATRIRLAMSQQLVAVAKLNDGRCFTHTVEVLVTIASCLED